MKYFSKKLGFTLIELLLVIAILGTIAAFGVNYYLQRTTETKASRAAAQYQLFLQAAANYQQNNGCWPFSTLCVQPVESFSLYSPTGAVYNPWGGKFTYSTIALNVNNKITEPKFQVSSTRIPQASANQIVNTLPNASASCDSNQSCTVISQIAQPLQSAQGLFVTTIGITGDISDSGTATIPAFSCPAGWTGNLAAFIGSIKAKDTTASSWTGYCTQVGSQVIANIKTTPTCQCAQNVCNCTVSVTSTSKKMNSNCDPSNTTLGTINVTYIGYCTSTASTMQASPLIQKATPLEEMQEDE